MSTSQITSISICMGSACFPRGNGRNIQVIESYLAAHPLPAGVRLTGHLCENQCCHGPNVTINGKLHNNVDPVVITALLQRYASDPPP